MIYSVFEEWPDREWEKENNISLFSCRAYWDLQKDKSREDISLTPILLKNKEGTIISFWCFANDGKTWKSPLNAPYFEPFLSKEVTFLVIFTIVTQRLKEKQNLPIEWTLPPQFHLPKENNFKEILKFSQIQNISIGHLISVNRSKSFTEIIPQKRKKRKLNSLSKNDYQISEANPNEWDTLYNQLLIWRKLKAHQNLMSKELILKSKALFPDLYRCLHLTLNGKTAGLAFYMHTNSHSFYIYSLITNPELDQKQPSLMLWEAIYEIAKNEGIQQIDLGTSMLENGQINRGLFHFKMALGASRSKKLTISC